MHWIEQQHASGIKVTLTVPAGVTEDWAPTNKEIPVSLILPAEENT